MCIPLVLLPSFRWWCVGVNLYISASSTSTFLPTFSFCCFLVVVAVSCCSEFCATSFKACTTAALFLHLLTLSQRPSLIPTDDCFGFPEEEAWFCHSSCLLFSLPFFLPFLFTFLLISSLLPESSHREYIHCTPVRTAYSYKFWEISSLSLTHIPLLSCTR